MILLTDEEKGIAIPPKEMFATLVEKVFLRIEDTIMANIMFFCIPAHGHFNPTINVVSELINRKHTVYYYLTNEFEEKIKSTGAHFISIDSYMLKQPDDLDKEVGKDFASLIEMVSDTTIQLDSLIKEEIEAFKPDCIISDSICIWGKLLAYKYQIPYICSTSSMTFNQYTARLMKQSIKEVITMLLGMPRINKKMKLLNQYGYQVDHFVSLIQNDNETNTIVYTTTDFQPMAETFSHHYAFVGPMVKKVDNHHKKHKPLIYISLGTILNQNHTFYKECIKALKNIDCDVIMSVGNHTDISKLGNIPASFIVHPYVDQIDVLSHTDVFITHCGMNSVNESLYYGVPMVLYPLQSEENANAIRCEELKVGIRLKSGSSKHIKEAVQWIFNHNEYKENALKMSRSFRNAKGAKQAVDFIENIIKKSK